MGLLKNIFNKSPTKSQGLELITDEGQGFYLWNGELYSNDIVKSCIRPFAKACGKLKGKHIRRDGEGLKVNPQAYMRFLLEEPNPFMTGQKLLEKVAVQLKLNSNAFILIVRDEYGYPCELYPMPARSVRVVKSKQGFICLEFYLKNGDIQTFLYSDILHLREDFNENDLLGDSPKRALSPLMEILNVTDQGVVRAVKNGAAIKWLLKYTTNLKEEDLVKNVKNFTKNFLSMDTETGGAAGVGAGCDAQQVQTNDFVPNALQMEKTKQRLYSFFNTNEKIVQSSYNENEWNAYYESEIEPFAIQISEEFTRKLFSRRERGVGNKIIFETANLQYASMTTKLNLSNMVDRGAMTPNEWRAVFGMAPVEGGDDVIRRLDTAKVETEKAGGEDNE